MGYLTPSAGIVMLYSAGPAWNFRLTIWGGSRSTISAGWARVDPMRKREVKRDVVSFISDV